MSTSSGASKKEHPEQYSNAFDRFDINKPSRKVKRETKRIRGEIACAECRRLKVRCDRMVPCSTCVKRGCSALCPNGTIPPGEGSRFVIAATDHLSRKMSRLEERMHSLEDALAIIHAATSDTGQPHPLLANRTSIDDDLSDDEEKKENRSEEGDGSGLADALGTLHIVEESGATRFYGPSGGSETLLFNAKDLVDNPVPPGPELEEIDFSYLPQEINLFFQSFPFTPPGIPTHPVQLMIESFLPPIDRATELCETFLEHMTWMTQVVSRQCIIGQLIPDVYKIRREGPDFRGGYGPHELALLFTVFAIGALVDLNLPPYNSEGQHYYRLARSAFCLQPVMTQRSVISIKALHLMSIYNGMSGKEGNLESGYFLLNFAAQVALMIGFHLDPSLWGIEGREAYDRRSYFWNLLAGDLWQSLITGRPPVITSSFIDCRIPSFEEENLYQRGEVPLGFGVWGFRYTVECVMPVVQVTLSAKPPTIRTTLDLDRKIREFSSANADTSSGSDRTSTSMREFARGNYDDLILIFLHRGFFARAVTDNPSNPSESPYSYSFHAAYRCACAIVECTRDQFKQKPLLCIRIWRIWSFAFSAAVIVGTVAARCPNLKLDPEPFEQFERAWALFQSAAENNTRAKRALPILIRIRQKIHQARGDSYSGYASAVGPSTTRVEADDELEIFGGKTRLIIPKRPTDAIPSASSSEPFFGPHPPDPSYFPNSSTALPEEASETPYQAIDPPHSSWHGTSGDTPSALPPGWENLYREISDPSYSYGPLPSRPTNEASSVARLPEEGVMLDDRWSSLTHQYGALGNIPRQRNN